MKRRYNRTLYQKRIEKIKHLIPHCCIGVDVIAGFPGETHDEFMETYSFLNHLDVSYLHVFTYSERKNTTASSMALPVPPNTRKERTTLLRTLSEKKKRAFYEANVDTTGVVLFEKDIQNGHIRGFTKNYIRTSVPYNPTLVNQTKKVSLNALNAEGIMEGTILSE